MSTCLLSRLDDVSILTATFDEYPIPEFSFANHIEIIKSQLQKQINHILLYLHSYCENVMNVSEEHRNTIINSSRFYCAVKLLSTPYQSTHTTLLKRITMKIPLRLEMNIPDSKNMDLNTTNRFCVMDGNVLNCNALHFLIKALTKTVNTNTVDDKSATLTLTNCFLHLLQHHNSPAEFKKASDVFGCCQISECNMFGRNYRNRTNNTNNYHNTQNAYCQILDKIHCFYQHSFDIANKLSTEKIMLKGKDYYTRNSIQSQPLVTSYLNDRLNNRYCQIFSYIENKKKTDELYNFGTEFVYGDDDYIVSKSNYTPIHKKYSSLKEELMNNNIATITNEQFNAEYEKAMAHFNSYYRKQTYANMATQQLFVLMIYCNFDALQSAFSKTYQKNAINHDNFYHFGKILKAVVQTCGSKVKNGNYKRFYHGIGKKVLFPELIEVSIYCPLSTSSSLQVATNFTNHNEGLIVEFTGQTSSAKYISTAWISDFANELEQFFIQNSYPLEINNIIDAQTGCEFNIILVALKIIDSIVTAQCKDDISLQLSLLIKEIIINQLSLKLHKYKSFKSLNKYAQEMVNMYCMNKKEIYMDLKMIVARKTLRDATSDFIDLNYGSIDLFMVHAMFPKIEYIVIRNVDLCLFTLDNILKCFRKTKIRRIKILPIRDSQLSITKAAQLYENDFKQQNVTIVKDEKNECWICINAEINANINTEKECSIAHILFLVVMEVIIVIVSILYAIIYDSSIL
eukprot:197449_1